MFKAIKNFLNKYNTDKPLFNPYSFFYAAFLWASVYFIERHSQVRITNGESSYALGVIFLSWVSTFRDMAQANGLRFRSLLVLVVVAAYLMIDVNGRVGYSAVAALFWTEIIDFLIFSAIFNKTKNMLAAVVTSDVITIPILWVFLFLFLNIPLSKFPYDTVKIQFLSLALLYLCMAAVFIPKGRWNAEFGATRSKEGE